MIATECRLARAALYAYVVMPHHVHLVVRLHETMNVRRFMNVFKREASRKIVPLLTETEIRAFDPQRGLNGNTFWQRSVRSIVIRDEAMFWQKVNYVHANPVRTGYVDQPEQYKWSSSALYLAGRFTEDRGLSPEAVENSLKPVEGGLPSEEVFEA